MAVPVVAVVVVAVAAVVVAAAAVAAAVVVAAAEVAWVPAPPLQPNREKSARRGPPKYSAPDALATAISAA